MAPSCMAIHMARTHSDARLSCRVKRVRDESPQPGGCRPACKFVVLAALLVALTQPLFAQSPQAGPDTGDRELSAVQSGTSSTQPASSPGDASDQQPTPSAGQQQSSPPAQGQSSAPGQTNAATEMEANVAEHDITYLKSRLVFRYDYKSLIGDGDMNRFRLKGLWGFGPEGRLGLAVTVPVIDKEVPGNSAFGMGDMEIQFGGIFYLGERFRAGAAVTFYPRTSTNALLGGASTAIKPATGFTALLNSRMELNCVFNYKISVHTVRGTPTNQFEPDFTLSTHRLGATIFLEWDSYYMIKTGDFAQTMKIGVSRSLGKRSGWVIGPYFSLAVNRPGSHTQYIHEPGIDVTWFPARWQRSSSISR